MFASSRSLASNNEKRSNRWMRTGVCTNRKAPAHIRHWNGLEVGNNALPGRAVHVDGAAPHAEGPAGGGAGGADLLRGEVRVVDELLQLRDDGQGDVVLVVVPQPLQESRVAEGGLGRLPVRLRLPQHDHDRGQRRGWATPTASRLTSQRCEFAQLQIRHQMTSASTSDHRD